MKINFEEIKVPAPEVEKTENLDSQAIDELKPEISEASSSLNVEKRSHLEEFLKDPTAKIGGIVANALASRYPKLALKILLATGAVAATGHMWNNSVDQFVKDNKPYVEKMEQKKQARAEYIKGLEESIHKGDSAITAINKSKLGQNVSENDLEVSSESEK